MITALCPHLCQLSSLGTAWFAGGLPQGLTFLKGTEHVSSSHSTNWAWPGAQDSRDTGGAQCMLTGWMDDGRVRCMNKQKRGLSVLPQLKANLQEPKLLWTLYFGALATPLPFSQSPTLGFLPFTCSAQETLSSDSCQTLKAPGHTLPVPKRM